MFVHQLQAATEGFAFRSPELRTNDVYPKPTEPEVVPPVSFDYYCAIHGTSMSGRVDVLPQMPGQPKKAHKIEIKNLSFGPPLAIHLGDSVSWINRDGVDHVVVAPGGGKPTFCLNGRAYVGNTPTIVANSGERLRWYVFNLDLNSAWHNFHPHATRWQLPAPPGGAADVHGLSPVEKEARQSKRPRHLRVGDKGSTNCNANRPSMPAWSG